MNIAFPNAVLQGVGNNTGSPVDRVSITAASASQLRVWAKEDEARCYLAATDPVIADYPFLAAEVGITAPTAPDLAALWVSVAGQWRGVAAQIETVRMCVTVATGAAATPENVDAALAQMQAALAAIGGGVWHAALQARGLFFFGGAAKPRGGQSGDPAPPEERDHGHLVGHDVMVGGSAANTTPYLAPQVRPSTPEHLRSHRPCGRYHKV